jgi:hypothetical protein
MLGPNQQKWVDALRSGEFNQTSLCLHDSCGYCCLGVACKAAEKDGVYIEYEDFGEETTDKYLYGETLDEQDLVMDWLDIKDGYGPFKETNLTKLNDDEGKSFKEIADIIEENAHLIFNSVK